MRPEQDMRRTRSASAPERLGPGSKSLPTLQPSSITVNAPMLVEHSRETEDLCGGLLNSNDSLEAHRGSLETSRLENICDSWNRRHWLKAESFLTYHLSNIDVPPDYEIARRIRHLLGACASYKGQWHKALKWFVSVIRTPVEDTRNLDPGDKAAFYWLGDIYSLLNRKEEALLAYCLAGTCDQLGPASRSLVNHRCLIDEQEQLRNTVSKEAFMNIWADASFHSGRAAEGTILHSTIFTQAVAKSCLQSFGTKAGPRKLHAVDQQNPQSRNRDITCTLDYVTISPNNFESGYSWPMPFDPMFVMANVARGRLFTHEVDFLDLLQQDPSKLQIRKKLPHDLFATCKCEDQSSLIAALRESLTTLSMGWTEMAGPEGAFFVVRYIAIQDCITTVNYFRIEIIRVPIWSEYAMCFCTNSVSSARVMHATPKTVKKLNAATEKELKSCPRTTLAAVTRQQNRRKANPSTTPKIPQTIEDKRHHRNPSPAPPPPPPKDPPTTPTPTAPSIPELRSSHSTPPSSIDTPWQPSRDISTLLPPSSLGVASSPVVVVTDRDNIDNKDMPGRARARISMRSSYNELHLLGPLKMKLRG